MARSTLRCCIQKAKAVARIRARMGVLRKAAISPMNP